MSTAPQVSQRLAELSAAGTSIWFDSISRSLISSGELERMTIEDSVVGVTSNPTIFQKAILGSSDYDERLGELRGSSAEEIYEDLAVEDVQLAADVLRPVWERTEGKDGYVSLEVAPALANDARGTVKAAQDFWHRLDRPNVMIKVPGTDAGVQAVKRLISEGVNVNITLLFSVVAYERIMDSYLAGLEQRLAQRQSLEGVHSVASFFVSRVDTLADKLLAERGAPPELQGTAAVANARLAYTRFLETFGGDRFMALATEGANRQRPLWASTGTKNEAYSDLKYVQELVGPDTVNTMPLQTLEAFRDHGESATTLGPDGGQPQSELDALAAAGVTIDEVTTQLLQDGIDSFAASMEGLVAGIAERIS